VGGGAAAAIWGAAAIPEIGFGRAPPVVGAAAARRKLRFGGASDGTSRVGADGADSLGASGRAIDGRATRSARLGARVGAIGLGVCAEAISTLGREIGSGRARGARSGRGSGGRMAGGGSTRATFGITGGGGVGRVRAVGGGGGGRSVSIGGGSGTTGSGVFTGGGGGSIATGIGSGSGTTGSGSGSGIGGVASKNTTSTVAWSVRSRVSVTTMVTNISSPSASAGACPLIRRKDATTPPSVISAEKSAKPATKPTWRERCASAWIGIWAAPKP
jgi:hypothetical protein